MQDVMFQMKMKEEIIKYRGFFYVALLLMISSCTGTKFLKEDESLYTGAEIKFIEEGRVGNKKRIRAKLEEQITQKPNTKILGSRPGIWFYFIAGEPKKKKGLRSFIKNKLGEPPILMKDVDPQRAANILQGTLFNNGYFEAEVEPAVIKRKKTSKVIYTATLWPPYRYKEITFPQPRDSVYKAIINEVEKETLLKPKRRYSLDRLKAEQTRIEKQLEDFGFYYFDNRYVIFEVDTTVGNRSVDVDLKLAPGIPDKAKRIYHFDEVNVFSNYSMTRNSRRRREIDADTVYINGYNYIDVPEVHNSFRPDIITRVINIRKGDIYTRKAHDYTLSHLMSLGTYKYVNIQYEDSPRDSASLIANIYLTPLLKKSIRFEVQGVSKSNNFVGPDFGVTFTNRNFLRGAERFELSVNSSYEVQVSRQQAGPLNSFELATQSSLSVPRFISPVRISHYNSRFMPHTRIQLGYNLQRRIRFFQLNSFNLSYGYTWRENTHKNHDLKLADINFVRLSRTSEEFNELLANNEVLENSFQNQFIIGTRYSYTLNTQLSEKSNTPFSRRLSNQSNFYFNGTIDVAGNLLRSLQSRIKSGEQEEPYQIFGLPYSQYLMGIVDFRYYWQIDRGSMLATRLVTGVGYALGNSTTLPYIKQFSMGGSNSVRAFPARSLGPGTYNVREDETFNANTFFIDQRGDIQLQGNLEYRFDIIRTVKGAVFTDAGNIWLMREDAERPGGEFNKETFISELAVGTGVGLRFDFNFFVLRFDVAFPLRKPYLPENERWVFNQIDFSDKTWRKENLVFNIAIGYPF